MTMPPGAFDDAGAHGAFDEQAGTFAGRPFPSEAEWLDLEPPPIAPDFVDRTTAALQAERRAAGDDAVRGDPLTPALLAHFAAPTPSPDFVRNTLHAVHADRRTRWRELLARHLAPDPSPDFVARTLAALAQLPKGGGTLAAGRRSVPTQPGRRWRAFALPVALAAAAAVVFALLQQPLPPPLEVRLAAGKGPAFAHAWSGSPLPAVLFELERAADPQAPPSSAADGMMLLARGGR